MSSPLPSCLTVGFAVFFCFFLQTTTLYLAEWRLAVLIFITVFSSLETVNNNIDFDWIALIDGKSVNPWANMFFGVCACWNSHQDCVHAVGVSCDINISLSLWITEASSWTPSCHATMWTECDHPLAREPDWAKGISHRHANSTNAPVRPKWQILSAMGFSWLFLHLCAT